MSAPPDIRTQLNSLTIRKEQRPSAAAAPSGASAGRASAAGRRRPLRLIGPMVAVAAAGAIVWYLAGGLFGRGETAQAGQAGEVRLLTVTARGMADVPPVFTATGKIVSDHKVSVSTKVSGQIVALLFEQGDRIAKGQVLARIEDVNYRAMRDQAAARLEKSRAALAYQQVNFDRVSRLHESSDAPDIEFVDARRALEEARAQVAADEAALTFAEKALQDCEVVAPIEGVVLERSVEVGDFVAAEGGRGAIANAQFAVIADMQALRVEVDISELDIARIVRDMPCLITPDAYKDRRFHGRVMWIDPGANYSKATVQAKVRIEQPDEFLRVEGSAQVAFFAERLDGATDHAAGPAGGQAIWIPRSACRADDAGGGTVFVAQGSVLRATPVRTGRVSGAQVEIVSGLSAGQRIAADGLDRLSDKQKIPHSPS
jgi:HlyD family secretion protein